MYNPNQFQGYNPYQPTFGSQFSPTIPQMQVTRVNGRNGASAYNIGANSSALLLDESGTMVWLITTDGAGYKTINPYDISPHQDTPAPDFSNLETRISRLEGIINEYSSNTTATKRRGKSTDTGELPDS